MKIDRAKRCFKNEWTLKVYNFSCLFFPFLDSGANVILTTGGIDDLCLKYFVEAGAMADANKLTSRGTYNIIYLYSFSSFLQFFGPCQWKTSIWDWRSIFVLKSKNDECESSSPFFLEFRKKNLNFCAHYTNWLLLGSLHKWCPILGRGGGA